MQDDSKPSIATPEACDDTARLQAWYARLRAEWEFPFGAHWNDGRTRFFVLVYAVLDPAEADDAPDLGLLVDARQENRPVFIPVASLELEPVQPQFPAWTEFCGFLRRELWARAEGDPPK